MAASMFMGACCSCCWCCCSCSCDVNATISSMETSPNATSGAAAAEADPPSSCRTRRLGVGFWATSVSPPWRRCCGELLAALAREAVAPCRICRSWPWLSPCRLDRLERRTVVVGEDSTARPLPALAAVMLGRRSTCSDPEAAMFAREETSGVLQDAACTTCADVESVLLLTASDESAPRTRAEGRAPPA